VERELFRNAALQLGYVGNTGIHLTSMADLNAIPSADWNQTAFLNGNALNAFRPAGNFGTIGLFDRAGHSTYHSLQALFRSRLSNYSNFQVSYTYFSLHRGRRTGQLFWWTEPASVHRSDEYGYR